MIPQGGTFVRPGVLAWDGMLAPPPVPVTSCEVIEQAIAGALRDIALLEDLLGELARARLWLPLPDGPKPVTDGSALTLPVIVTLEGEFVPAFTSVQRLGTWADPRRLRSGPASATAPVRSGDPAWRRDPWDHLGETAVIRHVVVPFAGLAARLPPELGIAINPGSRASLSVHPDAVAELRTCLAGNPAA
jgi:type III secretion system (T3SS) SseB-like protein